MALVDMKELEVFATLKSTVMIFYSPYPFDKEYKNTAISCGK